MFFPRRPGGRRGSVCAAFAIIALLGAGPAAAAGKAPSERPRIEADGYPWQAFGRVNQQGSGFCTGVLVGRAVVLTAAHCLYNRRAGLWADAARIHFLAAYDNRGYAFHARAARYEIAKGYDPSKTERSPAEAARDWAVLTLERPAPIRLGYLGIARVEKGTALPTEPEFSLAGYGRDRPYALSADLNCRLLGWDSDFLLLVHDCRAVRGISGAPVLRLRHGQALIYALHVGRSELSEKTVGGAVPGADFFQAVRAATGHGVEREGRLEILPGRAGN